MFRMNIASDNAAFDFDTTAEFARILRAVAQAMEDGRVFGACLDINGNTVGTWNATAKDDADKGA